MTTRQRATSVSPFVIEMWDGPKTVVVKNGGVIAYRVYGDENALKTGYYAAQANPREWWNMSPKNFAGNVIIPGSKSEPIGMSREEVEAILSNVDHEHYWRKDDTCRCGLSKE